MGSIVWWVLFDGLVVQLSVCHHFVCLCLQLLLICPCVMCCLLSVVGSFRKWNICYTWFPCLGLRLFVALVALVLVCVLLVWPLCVFVLSLLLLLLSLSLVLGVVGDVFFLQAWGCYG